MAAQWAAIAWAAPTQPDGVLRLSRLSNAANGGSLINEMLSWGSESCLSRF
jgi:hypothetical protein